MRAVAAVPCVLKLCEYMKILFLSHKIPFPPNKGDRIPTYYRMEYLAKQGHEVSMVFPCFSKADLRYVNAVKKFCKSVDTVFIKPGMAKIGSLFSLTTSKPLTLPYFYSKELHDKVKQRLASGTYDVVYVYSSSMAQYVFDVKGVKKIMDLADADSQKWLQYALYTRGPLSLIYRREGTLLKEYEQTICREFDEVIAISENEKSLFQTYIKEKDLRVVPNGVDYRYFSYNAENYNHKKLVFVGVMDYFANVDSVIYFARNILPLVRVRVPEVKFYIVGANPTRAVKALAYDRNIFVTGSVSDVRPYLRDACVCVVALRIAQGIQNKILQAMAAGTPVVTTAKGNEGINAVHGESIFVADEYQRFANYVIRMIEDPRIRMRIARSARRFVVENFQWQRNMEEFERIVAGARTTEIHEPNSQTIS